MKKPTPFAKPYLQKSLIPYFLSDTPTLRKVNCRNFQEMYCEAFFKDLLG